jgi:hypothetical protein
MVKSRRMHRIVVEKPERNRQLRRLRRRGEEVIQMEKWDGALCNRQISFVLRTNGKLL